MNPLGAWPSEAGAASYQRPGRPKGRLFLSTEYGSPQVGLSGRPATKETSTS
jgi:hypothetical protein